MGVNMNRHLESMLTETDADPVGLPDGVTFLSDEKSTELDEIIQKVSNIFRKSGYKKVLPPIFEYYETFEKGSGYNIARRAFSFKDKDGKLLSLRYDMTTPIARMAAMKYQASDLPLKFYYRGDVFREQPLHAGKPRQLRQVGIEFIGETEISADVETINLMGKSLAVLSRNYRIVIGDIRLYKHILSQLKLTPTLVEAVNTAFINKDVISLRIILEEVEGLSEYKEVLLHLPFMVGSPAKVEQQLEKFSDLGFSIYTDRLMNIVGKVDPVTRRNIIIDMGLIRDFSYYSSTTLEGYIDGVGYPVAGGGRYDELFRSFGRDFPAIGFALDISYYK